MLAEQLDLFGGPPRPPKQIRVEDPAPAPAEEPLVSSAPEAEPLPSQEAQHIVEDAPAADMPDWITETVTTEAPLLADNAWPQEPSWQEAAEAAPAIAWPDAEATSEEEEPATPPPAPLSEVIASLEPEEPLDDEEAAAVDAAAGEKPSAITVEYPEPRLKVEPITGDSILIVAVKHEEAAAPASATSGELSGTEGMNIPPDEELFKRQYYTMRETAGMFGISHSMLRYWENEFEVLQPRKNKKGDRYFRPADIKNLQLIHHLLKVRKFTIDGAREYLRHHNKALDTFELVQKLEKMKLFLQELKTHL